MFRLLTKPHREDARLGVLEFSQGRWTTEPLHTAVGEIVVSIDGNRQGPSDTALELARLLFEEADRHFAVASRYAQDNESAREFIEGNGSLLLDGFTVRADGSYAVELALSEWPDAMISVRVEGGTPCEVLLGD